MDLARIMTSSVLTGFGSASGTSTVFVNSGGGIVSYWLIEEFA